MTTTYPCELDLDHPARFDRSHLVLRLAILMVLAVVGAPLGALLMLGYVLLPLITAAEISERKERFLTELAPRIVIVLQFMLDALAYLMLLTDHIPRLDKENVRFTVTLQGEPTVYSALRRPIYALPEAIVIAMLGFFAVPAWIIAGLCVLATNNYPNVIFSFLRGLLRWIARLFAYLGSLVDRYPPFRLQLGPSTGSVRP